MNRKDVYLVISNPTDSTIDLLIDKLRESKVSFSDYKYKQYNQYLVVHIHIDDKKIKSSQIKKLFKNTSKDVYFDIIDLNM